MKSNSKETNRIKEPSKFAINFANTVFVLGILFSILIIVYAIYRIYNPYGIDLGSRFYLWNTIYILCGGISATLFGLGLRLKNSLKVNLSLLIFITGISVYALETYLEFFREEIETKQKDLQQKMAEKIGVPYDTRTKIEVLDDLRKKGVEVYPKHSSSIEFSETNGLITNEGRIFPIGGISRVQTLGNNESGYYPFMTIDEYGFHNQIGLYNKNEVDIVLTGDSFTEGYSVNSKETISAVLRKLGFNAISVGKSGNGPLIELAALEEYAKPLEPTIVFWMYYVNDLDDLKREMKSSLLRKYLYEDAFSQNLISRQNEIDSVLINYIGGKLDREKEKQRVIERERIINHWSIRVFKLTNLRTRLNLISPSAPTPTLIFKEIMQKAKQMVSGWEGKMYFVYLPSITTFSTGNEYLNRDFVIQTATELNIPVIDIHKEVFDPHPDPLSLFPFRMIGHYNAKGYKLIGESISKRLKADGIIPLNSKN